MNFYETERAKCIEAFQSYYMAEGESDSHYPMIRKIVAEKIDAIIGAKHTEWLRLVEEMQKLFPQAFVMDLSASQFPSYLLRVDLGKKDFSHGEEMRSIVVVVSLLTNHYTFFLEECFVFNHIKKIDLPASVIRFYRSLPDEKEVQEISQAVVTLFPRHSFISHWVLLSYKIPAVRPWPDPPNPSICEPASLYEMLFDGLTPLHNVNVVT